MAAKVCPVKGCEDTPADVRWHLAMVHGIRSQQVRDKLTSRKGSDG